MVGFYNYTVYLTYIGLISSLLGIFLSFTGNIGGAVICLLVSGMCDMFDGKIARTKKDRTELEKAFGIQIDSLCDVICFGVFPAVLSIAVGAIRVWQLTVAALFCVCGVIRLAYFNVLAENRQNSPGEKDTGYLGVPITTSALTVPLLMCFQNILGTHLAFAYSLLLLVMGICYIAPLKVRKPGKIGCAVMILMGIVILAFSIKNCGSFH